MYKLGIKLKKEVVDFMVYPTKCDICGDELPQKPTPVLGGVQYNEKVWCLKCYNSRNQTIELEKMEWEILILYLSDCLSNDANPPKDIEQIYRKIKEQQLKNV